MVFSSSLSRNTRCSSLFTQIFVILIEIIFIISIPLLFVSLLSLLPSYVEQSVDQFNRLEKETEGEKGSQAAREGDQESTESSIPLFFSVFTSSSLLPDPSNDSVETLVPSSNSFLPLHSRKRRRKRTPLQTAIPDSTENTRQPSIYAEYHQIADFKAKASRFDDVETCVKDCTQIICISDDVTETSTLSSTDSLEFCSNKLCRQRLCSQVSSRNCYQAMTRYGKYKTISMSQCIATCGCDQIFDELSHKQRDSKFTRNGK